MKKKFVFSGAATALITPMRDGEIDYIALARLIDFQLSGGADALVIAGTTGEAPTLSPHEFESLVSFCTEHVGGKIPVICGAGSNDTKKSVEKAKACRRLGADALLVVTPYYNKGTDDGLTRHFFEIADAGELPVMLYNIPGRSGVNLSIEKLSELSLHPNICALKEAHDSTERLADIFAACPDLAVFAGNDAQILPCLSLGGEGVVSVVSNLFPGEVHDICKLFLSDMAESRRIQLSLLPLIRALFKETNPAPVKYAASLLFGISPECRLPLGEIPDSLKEEIKQLLKKRIPGNEF